MQTDTDIDTSDLILLGNLYDQLSLIGKQRLSDEQQKLTNMLDSKYYMKYYRKIFVEAFAKDPTKFDQLRKKSIESLKIRIPIINLPIALPSYGPYEPQAPPPPPPPPRATSDSESDQEYEPELDTINEPSLRQLSEAIELDSSSALQYWNQADDQQKEELIKLSSDETISVVKDNDLINKMYGLAENITLLPINFMMMFVDCVAQKYEQLTEQYTKLLDRRKQLARSYHSYIKTLQNVVEDSNFETGCQLAKTLIDTIEEDYQLRLQQIEQEMAQNKLKCSHYRDYFNGEGNFTCKICYDHKIEVVASCGHTYCKQCLTTLEEYATNSSFSNYGPKKCSFCNKVIETTHDIII